VANEADFLARLVGAQPSASETHAAPPQLDDKPTERSVKHPQVCEALEYIEEHLSDPKLTIREIAHRLGFDPDYLSRLFNEQVGQRMGPFITARRMQRAKHLLASTTWQIKRVARESGYANPNWFSHVFHTHTGMTPCEYRRQARQG
jgi:transcriptional regulator GlxA family with amidase domain